MYKNKITLFILFANKENLFDVSMYVTKQLTVFHPTCINIFGVFHPIFTAPVSATQTGYWPLATVTKLGQIALTLLTSLSQLDNN